MREFSASTVRFGDALADLLGAGALGPRSAGGNRSAVLMPDLSTCSMAASTLSASA